MTTPQLQAARALLLAAGQEAERADPERAAGATTVHFLVTKDAEGNPDFEVVSVEKEQPEPEQHDHRLGWNDEAPV